MTVGFLAVFVAWAVGTFVALVSGVFKGCVDRVLMQITDAFLALPYLMIAVTGISILKPSLMVVILVDTSHHTREVAPRGPPQSPATRRTLPPIALPLAYAVNDGHDAVVDGAMIASNPVHHAAEPATIAHSCAGS